MSSLYFSYLTLPTFLPIMIKLWIPGNIRYYICHYYCVWLDYRHSHQIVCDLTLTTDIPINVYVCLGYRDSHQIACDLATEIPISCPSEWNNKTLMWVDLLSHLSWYSLRSMLISWLWVCRSVSVLSQLSSLLGLSIESCVCGSFSSTPLTEGSVHESWPDFRKLSGACGQVPCQMFSNKTSLWLSVSLTKLQPSDR